MNVTAWWLSALVGCIGLGIIGTVVWWSMRIAREDDMLFTSSFAAPPPRHPRDAEIAPVEDPHRAYDGPMTVQQAHRETQLHRECVPSGCPRKRQALATLTRSGRMVPPQRRRSVIAR